MAKTLHNLWRKAGTPQRQLQNFLSALKIYFERQVDEPYWGGMSEGLIDVIRGREGQKQPTTAEESFTNFATSLSHGQGLFDVGGGPGQVETIREIWEASGKPFIKFDPKLKRGDPAYFKAEGMPKRFLAGSSLFSQIGKVPSYVSEQRFPVDTVGVHSPEVYYNIYNYSMDPIVEKTLSEFAHAKQFGPDLYEHQYPVGTKITEKPSDYLEWAQPKTTESLQRLAERRSQASLQGLVEELEYGESRYRTPETIESTAHGQIETELKSLYKEKYAPRKQLDTSYMGVQNFMGLLQLILASHLQGKIPTKTVPRRKD